MCIWLQTKLGKELLIVTLVIFSAYVNSLSWIWILFLERKEFVYRVDDTPKGMEPSQHRKHMLYGVSNGGQLELERKEESHEQMKKII